jgi:hypothetical protein
VTFQLRDQFFKQNESAIRQSAAGFKDPQITEVLLARAHHFYSEFQWIASITVPRCDSEVSRRRAHGGIQKAFDIFKLLVGSQRASDVKRAHDLTTPSQYVELVSYSSGTFSLQYGGKLPDAVLNDCWWPLLQAVLVKYCKAWDNLDEIQTRLMDALSWHSDAISEQDSGAKIIKFWTAIERILSTSHGHIESRAAVLSSATFEEFVERSKGLSVAYRGRNDVIHGNANRSEESRYVEAVAASEEASKNALFQYLFAIPQIRAHQGSTDRKKLRAWLKTLDGVAEQYRRQLRGESPSAERN